MTANDERLEHHQCFLCEFAAAHKQMESYQNRTCMRQANPPVGVNPRLVTWLSLE